MSALDPEEKNVTNPTRPPISTRKIEANRRNAQLSTGPKTPKGKRTISRNATKHGILSGEVVNTALGERPEDFYALLKELWEHHKPVGRAEEMDVEKIAVGSWRLKRVLRAENGEIARGVNLHLWGLLSQRAGQFCKDRLQWELMRAERKLGRHEDKTSFADQVLANDEIIQNLKRTLDGLDFLGGMLSSFKEEVEKTASLSDEARLLMLDLLGIEWVDFMPEIKSDGTGMLEEEELKEFLADISLQMSRLEAQRKCLQTANEREFEALSRSLSLPAKDATDKLLRYESHVERQLARDRADLERRQMRRRGEPVSPHLQIHGADSRFTKQTH